MLRRSVTTSNFSLTVEGSLEKFNQPSQPSSNSELVAYGIQVNLLQAALLLRSVQLLKASSTVLIDNVTWWTDTTNLIFVGSRFGAHNSKQSIITPYR